MHLTIESNDLFDQGCSSATNSRKKKKSRFLEDIACVAVCQNK